MEKKPIAIACRMDSDRALTLAKNIFQYLTQDKKREVILETRIAPKIPFHQFLKLIEDNTTKNKTIAQTTRKSKLRLKFVQPAL